MNKQYDYVPGQVYEACGMEDYFYLFHVTKHAQKILEEKMCIQPQTGRFQYRLKRWQREHLDNLLEHIN